MSPVVISDSVNGPIAAGVPDLDPELMLCIEADSTSNGDETGSGGRNVGPGSEGGWMTGGDNAAVAPGTRFPCEGTAVPSMPGEGCSFIRDT